jgi:hypothetical protein
LRGARRAGATVAARILQRAGIIIYNREAAFPGSAAVV